MAAVGARAGTAWAEGKSAAIAAGRKEAAPVAEWAATEEGEGRVVVVVVVVDVVDRRLRRCCGGDASCEAATDLSKARATACKHAHAAT